jgi:hypothetical protein
MRRFLRFALMLVALSVASRQGPAIGERIMKCDLGRHPSVFVNDAELGKTYTPARSSGWPNLGGFKKWPAPLDRGVGRSLRWILG